MSAWASRMTIGATRSGCSVASGAPAMTTTVGATRNAFASSVSFEEQRGDLLTQRRVDVRIGQGAVGRQWIGLGHHDVDADRRRSVRVHRMHQPREQRAWPRPSAELRQTPIVDCDDRHRRGIGHARRQPLQGVEPCRLQRQRSRQIERKRDRERDQDRRADKAHASGSKGRYLRRSAGHNTSSSPS